MDVPYSHLTKGSFSLPAPISIRIYFRSVIIICEHSPSGSFGLIVNKSLDVELPEELINVKEFVNPNVQIRAGGPIQPNQMMLLHRLTKFRSDPQAVRGCLSGWRPAISSGNRRQCEWACHPPLFWLLRLGRRAARKRIFKRGMVFPFRILCKHIFQTPPEKIWQTILREMGGKYATLSMIPEDLSLN